MKRKPADTPKRGRPFNDVPSAPINCRAPLPAVEGLERLRGDMPAGAYLGTLIMRELKRKKL